MKVDELYYGSATDGTRTVNVKSAGALYEKLTGIDGAKFSDVSRVINPAHCKTRERMRRILRGTCYKIVVVYCMTSYAIVDFTANSVVKVDELYYGSATDGTRTDRSTLLKHHKAIYRFRYHFN